MLTNYDNIVFDLGGVILDIDRDLCVANLEALGLGNAASLLDLYKQSGDFLALEEGRISSARFFDLLRRQCSCPDIDDEKICCALGSFITGLPAERLKAIRSLRAMGKRTYVLSNTNPVMFPTRISGLFRGGGLEIDDYFDGLILSYRERLCKPSPEIFRRLLNRYGLNPERTIFLDDSAHNCEAAESVSIRSALVPPGTEFMDILTNIE